LEKIEMKKTLVAIAAMSAISAFAQSSVTISGTLDPSVANSNTTFGNGTSVSRSFVRNNSQGTSQVTFTGVEDLGGGLKATFRYEADFNASIQAGSGNALGDGGGDIFAGLEGGFGAIKLGAPNTPSLTVQASRNFWGTKIGSGFGGVSGTGHVREDNSLRYDTPNFGGFSATVYYTFGTPATPVANGGTNTVTNAKSDIGLFYNNGPISAALSFYNQADVNAQVNFAASYNLGIAKIYLGAHTEDKKAAGISATSKGYNLGGDFNVSPSLSVSANFGVLDDESPANADRRIAGLGAKYSLSKRTSVYTRYVAEANDNVTSAAAVRDVKTLLVGVQHNF
jgi:predicted porin